MKSLPTTLEQQNPSNKFDLPTVRWLKKRCGQSAKGQYLMTRQEFKHQQEIESVFHKFDFDNSGTIEFNELFAMFKAHGMDIRRKELKTLFDLADTDGSGGLSLEEFKRVSENKQAEKIFRRLVKRMRDEQQRSKDILGPHFLPYNMSRMLDHLSVMQKRELLVNKIESQKFDLAKTDQNIHSFIKLFILDESAKDSIVKEEQAAKIVSKSMADMRGLASLTAAAQIEQESQVYGIKRLDSNHLNQLTQKELEKPRYPTLKRTMGERNQTRVLD